MSTTACRRARRVVVGAFVVLLALCCLRAASAQTSIIWRTSVVSWDSPTTQFRDELAIQGIVYVDGARQLREHAGAALAPAGRLAVPPDPTRADAAAVSSRLTRSPPAV